MNKNIRYFLYSLLFCLIFIVSLSFKVYAIEGTVNAAGDSLMDGSTVTATITEIQTGVKNDYAKKFQKMAEANATLNHKQT